MVNRMKKKDLGSRRKVRDEAPCRICGAKLWQHPRCTECRRFLWCTEPGPVHRQCQPGAR